MFWGSFSVHHQESSTVHTATGLCHTGFADCPKPKHVEPYSKNKFEILVHLIGSIRRIYHNARSSERQRMSNLITGILWLSTKIFVGWVAQLV